MDEFEDDEVESSFDPNDTEEDIEDDFDPNDTEEDIEDDFDPNDTEEDIDDDFDPNDTEKDTKDDFDPSDTEEDIDDDFDPNDYVEDIEDDFDPNEYKEDEFDDKINSSEEDQYHNENIGSQSTSTVLTNKIEEIESNVEHQEQEEEIEVRSEEYQDDTEPIVNNDEIEFIKDVEELAEHAREIKAEDENIEPQTEKENAAYYAEQYYEALKEKEVLNDQDSKEGQETEELKQEVTEELNGHQESDYKSAELEEEDIIKASEEIISTEEFEYLWEVRDKLDREGKTSEEIEDVMHEAEQIYETLKDAEKLYEEQQQEKLKLVDHEDEATEEDLKEELDRGDLVEQAVELEEKLVQQGKSQEEIDVRIEESVETTMFEEKLEKLIEEQEREKLKQVDHEDEATEEDLKEELDRGDLVEQAVELEEKLVQQGKSQEEIDVRIEESVETTMFEEKLEEIIGEQEREKLKQADHEDEATEEDLKEELDRGDLVEQAVELEEKLVQQGKSQEEIDMRVEESIETTKLEEKLEKIIEKEQKELKPELDAIESESEDKKDLLEESTKLGSEESDEEEIERLQELYRQETGKRPIYARKKTNGYSQWLEQRELDSEKIKNSKSESEKIKEIKEEDWKQTLNQWIKEASEEECNVELKSELKKVLESYNEFGDLTRKFLELYEKSQHGKLSEKEKNILKSLTKRLQKLDPIKLELSASVFFIKKYITEQYWSDFWNRPLVNRVLSKFFNHISQKYKNLTHDKQNLLNKTINLSDLKKIEIIDSFENYGLIYKITNQINGKIYIGRTIQKLKRRLQQHLNESRHLRKKTFLIYAIKKYGKENFEVEVVNFFEDIESLNEAEKYYIKKFKSNAFRFSKGYNMTDGGENFRILYGEEHPQFVNINIESLKELIQEGHSTREMAEEFKVSYTVIQNRLNELGFVNIQEAREKLGGLKKRQEIRRSRMSQSAKGRLLSDKTKVLLSEQRRGSNNHRFIIFKRNQLIEAIKECGKKKGGRFTLVDVANELKTTKNTVMHKVKQILGISFPEAKNQHFFAPKIKELIKNGRTAGEITKKLGYSERWLTWSNNKIRELWGLSFREAVRRFRVYPKINNDLLMSLISENLSVKEIDEVFIKILILSNTLKEITELLETNKDTIYKLVQQVFGFNNLTDARSALGGLEVIEFLEHSRRENISKAKQRFNISAQSVKSMIENGLKMREIAEKIGCSKTTIQVKIKELFNKKYSKLRDENYLKPLLKSLIQKNLSLNQIAHELNMKPKNLGSLLYRLYRTESICKLREKQDL